MPCWSVTSPQARAARRSRSTKVQWFSTRDRNIAECFVNPDVIAALTHDMHVMFEAASRSDADQAKLNQKSFRRAHDELTVRNSHNVYRFTSPGTNAPVQQRCNFVCSGTRTFPGCQAKRRSNAALETREAQESNSRRCCTTSCFSDSSIERSCSSQACLARDQFL